MTNKCLCAAIAGAILALAPLFPAHAGEHAWSEARPSGGVATLLVHTADALYMVSGARVYRSSNDGTTWALHATLPSDIVALATPAGSPAVLVAATVSHGIQRSADAGATWTQAATAAAVGFDVHPSDGTRLYAAVPGTGVLTSADGGASWSALATQPASLAVVDVTVDPVAPAILYAGTEDAGVFRSGDGGTTWLPVVVGLDVGQSYDRVYASPHADAGGTRSKVLLAGSTSAPTVYRSDDEGANWTAITSNLPPPGSGMVLQQLQFDPDPRFLNGMYMTFKGASVAFPDTFFNRSDPDASTGGVNWGARRCT